MTITTDNKTTLTPEQEARVLALAAAKTVLTGTGGIFGGTENRRSTTDLIEIADYIIGYPDEIRAEGNSDEGAGSISGQWEHGVVINVADLSIEEVAARIEAAIPAEGRG